ncbi:Formiminotransferase cyclodeaminase-like protein [Drosera capensis]
MFVFFPPKNALMQCSELEPKLDEIHGQMMVCRSTVQFCGGNQWTSCEICNIDGRCFVNSVTLFIRAYLSKKVAEQNQKNMASTPSYKVTRRIARMISAPEEGGLPTVQTLGLVHGEESSEIACMLLEPNQVGADRVQNRVQMLAAEEGLDVEQGYFTDFSPEMLVEKYMNLMSGR